MHVFNCQTVHTWLYPLAVELPLLLANTALFRHACDRPGPAPASSADGAIAGLVDPFFIGASPLSHESFLWVPSLTDADPTFILPIAVGIVRLLNAEYNARARREYAVKSMPVLGDGGPSFTVTEGTLDSLRKKKGEKREFKNTPDCVYAEVTDSEGRQQTISMDLSAPDDFKESKQFKLGTFLQRLSSVFVFGISAYVPTASNTSFAQFILPASTRDFANLWKTDRPSFYIGSRRVASLWPSISILIRRRLKWRNRRSGDLALI
jgi:hypothetical protein